MKKITLLNDFLKIRSQLAKQKIVFTNGCFDLLHVGHIDYLQRAKKLGDFLVIGLNSDYSVQNLKGNKRPINVQQDRQAILCALKCVDAVLIFDDPTPYSLIEQVHPHILVKGGDWSIDKIVGGDLVRSWGGEVFSLPFLPGYSSSQIIEKIISRYS